MYADQQTQMDLRWRMFGIDVRVQPLFWLVALVMGWRLLQAYRDDGMLRLLLWVAVLFVSILVHELGHVFMGRYFGARGNILIYGFGGLAIGSSALHLRRQRILVYLAGPAAGFLLVGVIVAPFFVVMPEVVPVLWQNTLALVNLARWAAFPPQVPSLLAGVLQQALWINVFWGVMNLLPIWPLDGGQVSRDVCTALSPKHGLQAALAFSIALAALLAIHALSATYERPLLPFLSNLEGFFPAMLFGLLALEGYQELQRTRELDSHWDRDDWR